VTEFRFLHAADLHLGRRFASFGTEAAAEETRGALVAAREEQIGALAAAAGRHGAAHVLVAGDLFDTVAPTPTVLSRALAAMRETALRWWIIPGNHDSLAAEALWEEVEARRAPNVCVLSVPEPVEMEGGVFLLPAPVPSRFPGRDLSEPLDRMATPEGALRIGLAHGPSLEFGDDSPARIPRERQDSARLHYLALGDRHDFTRVASRTWYAGTPERDSFDYGGRGTAAAVTLRAGEEPRVERVETGRFGWERVRLDLLPGMDAAAALEAALTAARAQTLLSVAAGGRTTLAERARLLAAAGRHGPEFRHFTLDLAGLVTEPAAGDLDAIATGGALRAAAETLRAAATLGAEAERRTAEAALARLYALAVEVGR
jgi:hypothetical protein